MNKLCALILFLLAAEALPILDCNLRPDTYDQVSGGQLTCSLFSPEDDPLSMISGVRFVFKVCGVGAPASSFTAYILLDNVNTAVTYQNMSNCLAFSVIGPMNLTTGVTHTFIAPVTLLPNTMFGEIKFYTYISGTPNIFVYDVNTYIFAHGNSAIMPDCVNKTIFVGVVGATNISEGSNIKITLPSYMKFTAATKGPCTSYLANKNVNDAVECESTVSEMKLYNVVSRNIFSQEGTTIGFYISGFSCSAIQSNETIRVAIFNEHSDIVREGEHFISFISASSITPENPTCADGSYLSGSDCMTCTIPNCLTCSSLTVCTACVPGTAFFLFNDSCVDACPIGYLKNLSSCIACNPLCVGCNYNVNNCSACVNTNQVQLYGECRDMCPNQTYALEKICFPCLLNCNQCQDNVSCSQCIPGFFADANECLQCVSPCLYCSALNTCSSCVQGYTFNGTTCIVSDCPQTCLSCSAPGVCSECNQGYFLNSSGSCATCSSIHCSSCINSSFCSGCLDGYFIYNNMCSACEPMCTTCSSLNVCNSCSAAYYLDGSSCVKCSSPCELCDSLNVCKSCVGGYNLTGTTCVIGNCPANCLLCSAPGVCSECNQGFYKNSTGTCIACASTCTSCGDNGFCNSCKDGYFAKNGVCTLCKSPCTLCRNETVCSKCIDGYFTYNNACTACEPKCLTCTSLNVCNTCSAGYYLSNTSCLACSSNCQSCKSYDSCSVCVSPFIASNGKCICDPAICKSKCSTPTATGCDICNGKYFYNPFNSAPRCDACNLTQIQRNPYTLKYSICTGKISVYVNSSWQNESTGYSGTGTYKNNVCNSTLYKKGSISIGSYVIANISCAFDQKARARVLSLKSVDQFSNDSIYKSLYTDLYVYSEDDPTSDKFTYSQGQSGIVVNNTLKNLLTVGDIINVTNDECEKEIKACTKFPPPTIGSINIVKQATNEYIINFKNWGGLSTMDSSILNYSVQLISNGNIIEFCTDVSTITANGIICNKNNNLKLGFFQSGKSFQAKLRAKYSYNSTKEGVWAETYTTILIENVVSTDSASTVISKNITANNASSLINELNYNKQAMDTVIVAPTVIPKVDVCPTGYCKNQGTCAIVQKKPRCTCATGFSGTTCDSTTANIKAVTTQMEQASNVLVNVVNTTDANTIISLVNTITSNTDTVSSKTITNSIVALQTALKSNSSKQIEPTQLKKTVSNLLTAMIKNMVTKKAKRLLTDTAEITDAMNMTDLISIQDFVLMYVQSIGDTLGNIIDNFDAGYFDVSFYKYSAVGSISGENYSISLGADTTDAIIVNIPYPSDIAANFPIPAANGTINSSIGSDVISFITLDIVSPFDKLLATKKITYTKASLGERKLETTFGDNTVTCGYYDEVVGTYGSEGCTATLETSGDLSCSCKTLNANQYLVFTPSTPAIVKKMKLSVLLMAIIIPCGLAIIISSIIISCCCCKKRVSVKVAGLQMDTSINPIKAVVQPNGYYA